MSNEVPQRYNWSSLNGLQLGRYAEYFAKMEFSMFGFEVFTSEVDDRGIDFVVRRNNGAFKTIQVKSCLKSNYVFMRKQYFELSENNYLFLLLFNDGELPTTYLIPAVEWRVPNALLKDKDYEGLKSAPEWGLQLSQKNLPLLQEYDFDKVVIKI